ncbi:MAG: hypothetical protein BZY79_05250 [SAR202 cluster bacterium Casp-Chloro-G4]|nr:MAG: hypothetical protein BZY79_05250 [SAR202 cluster bacterium Casp-Chloro-G4]
MFANAVLEHLGEPLKALSEMKRVVKSGGVVGVRDTDQGSHVYPESLKVYLAAMQQMWKHNDGNPFIGRELRPLLVQAGFVSTQGSATVDCFGTAEGVKFYAETNQSMIRGSYGSTMVERGIATRTELESFDDAFEQWKKRPDAFAGICYCEALGWKA